MSEFGAQSLANTALAFAKLYCLDRPLMAVISAEFLLKIADMEVQNLTNIAWAFATMCIMDAPLMEAISAEALGRLDTAPEKPRSLKELHTQMLNVLALSWSLAMSEHMDAGIALTLQDKVVELGVRMDHMLTAAAVRAPGMDDEESEGNPTVQLPGMPYAKLDLPDIMVIFKPENWEVNRGDPALHRHGAEQHLLSDWVTRVLPRRRYPLMHSIEFDFGFVHRLDVPSSGLLLAAKTFAGLGLLRFQLDTYGMAREYVVLVANAVDPSWILVKERLNKDNANMKSYVDPKGAPACTRLKGLAHAWPILDPDVLVSLIAVKIRTGRHHQIRAHVTHHRHPPMADAKYGLDQVLLKDDKLYRNMLWYEQTFHRPVVPLFLESGPKGGRS